MSERMHESGFDSVGTHYTRLGIADGPVVVMIHGLGMSQDYWQPQMMAFASAFQVIVYDILGHGESPMPEEDVAMDDMVDQLHGLLHDLEVSAAHMVGHSMGALIATGFALAHPKQTLSLAALNSVYDRPTDVRQAAEARAADILSGASKTGNDTTFNRWFGDTPPDDQADAIDWIKSKVEDNDPTGYGQIYSLFSRSDDAYVGKLGELACPALFMTGALDPNSTPEMSEKMAMAAPHGVAVVLENERHMMSLVSPAETTNILGNFLVDAAGGNGIGIGHESGGSNSAGEDAA